MKTCEEYVLNRLESLETELEVCQQNMEDLAYRLADTVYNVSLIKKRTSLKNAPSGNVYISFDTVWDNYDKEVFDQLVDFLELKEDEDDEEDNITG